MTRRTRRRADRSSFFAKVTRRSASGRSRLALVSVVVIRPCLNSEVARLASISRSCAGLPPRRGPLVGVGMVLLPVWWRQRLQLLGLAVVVDVAVVGVVVVGVAEGVDDVRRVEAGRRVLQAQAHSGQLHLDLVDRL